MASKSKKRRRVFRASCILAALIIAGSSFAWFTSKDEVTNRLSANADYDVKIVESFAPPKNFLPGQEVNKDVYAVNTGTIAAFVRETITSKMTITQEKRVEGTTDNFNSQKDELVKLTPAEVYSVEAGSYLAYKPTGSQAVVGKQVVAFRGNEVTPATDPVTYNDPTTEYDYNAINEYDAGKNVIVTDFAPDANGLYVFRRAIKVNEETSAAPTKDDLRENTEDFTYEAYYYDKGDFYKVMLTSVTGDDVMDLADDGKDTDGILSTVTAPTYNFFKEETKTVTPKLYYDAEKHRLVAKVDGFDVNTDTYPGTSSLGKTYDDAVDAYEDALIKLYDAVDQYEDMQAEEKEKYLAYIQKLIATNKAEQTYVNELNNYNTLTTATTNAKTELTNKIKDGSGDTLKSAAEDLFGNKSKDYKPAGVTIPTLDSEVGVNSTDYYASAKEVFGDGIADPDDTLTGKWAAEASVWDPWYNKVTECGNSKFKSYVDAKRAYEMSIHDEDDRKAADAAFLAELKAYCQSNAGWTGYNDFTTIEEYAEYLRDKTEDANGATNYINEFVNWVAADTTREKHDQYAKRAALLKAETEYNEAVDLYKTMVNQVDALNKAFNTEKGLRDTSKGKLYGTDTEHTPLPVATIDGYTTGTELNTALGDWSEQTDSYYYKYIDAKDKELEAKEAYEAAKGAEDATAITTTVGAKKAKEEAEKAVANAKAALDKAKMAYEQGTEDYENAGDIIIYVNLNNDTTVGGTKDKWQLVPVKTLDDELTDDTAVFYYTGILQGGETSTKLIDSVTLDKDVTQYMYKSFDFDLDVKMDSAQIAYGSDDITLQATPANEEFGTIKGTSIKGANVALADPTDIETALTWTVKPTT